MKSLTFILLILPFVFFSQNKIKITAHVENLKTGFVQGRVLSYSELAFKIKEEKIKLIDGKFEFVINVQNLKEPFPIYFFIYDGEKPYMKTDIVILPAKSQTISINKDGNFDLEESFLTIQKRNYESFFESYNNSFKKFIERGRKLDKPSKNEIDEMISTRNTLVIKKDSLLFDFSKSNKDSYFLLNDLAQSINTYGYKEIYERSFENLSSKVKRSFWAKNVLSELKISKNFKYDNQFPISQIGKTELQKLYGKKLTLVDFWFSYCSPCIAEMPFYSEVYSKYKNNGFEILSISTDRTKDLPNWKKQIESNKMNWPQVLDENGIVSKKFNINKFPTNFLLDGDGKIIKRDISKVELLHLLKKHIP